MSSGGEKRVWTPPPQSPPRDQPICLRETLFATFLEYTSPLLNKTFAALILSQVSQQNSSLQEDKHQDI